MTTNDQIFEVNTFYHLAMQYIEDMTLDSEIRSKDVTKIFWEELEQHIKNGETITIEINGRVRLGKSTESFAIGKAIFEMLKKYKIRTKTEQFTIKNIARDDQEYSRLMRDPETRNTVICTDEENELEKGGENSSAEKALKQVFSDVHAARYVHRVNCSPRETIDTNSEITLEVIGTDPQTMTTHNLLYYRVFKAGQVIPQLIGYVNINVKDIIQNWITNVKPIFYKTIKTKEDEKYIQEQATKDWYVEYVIRKHQKMDMLVVEGIFRPRMLEYASIILEIEQQLRKLSAITTLKKTIIRNYVKYHAKQKRIPLSIIGEELLTQELMGIFEPRKDLNKLYIKQDNLRKDFRENKITQQQYAEKSETYEQAIEELQKSINYQLEELKHYKELNDKYNKTNEGEAI